MLRSGLAVGGSCSQPGGGPVEETAILAGGQAETSNACWCCAPSGETCTPANESGIGQALLVNCFK